MDKGFTLTIAEVGTTVTLSAGTTNYKYGGFKGPNHTCSEPKALKPRDVVVVQNVAPSSVLVTGPCGCNFLLYDKVPRARLPARSRLL